MNYNIPILSLHFFAVNRTFFSVTIVIFIPVLLLLFCWLIEPICGEKKERKKNFRSGFTLIWVIFSLFFIQVLPRKPQSEERENGKKSKSNQSRRVQFVTLKRKIFTRKSFFCLLPSIGRFVKYFGEHKRQEIYKFSSSVDWVSIFQDHKSPEKFLTSAKKKKKLK